MKSRTSIRSSWVFINTIYPKQESHILEDPIVHQEVDALIVSVYPLGSDHLTLASIDSLWNYKCLYAVVTCNDSTAG